MKLRLLRPLALALIFESSSAAGQNDAMSARAWCEREMLKASKRYQVPVNVLYAVGLTETGDRGSMQPFAMNVDGKAVQAANLTDALARFEKFRREGAHFIDIGCMQINHHFHAKSFSSLSAMFDPAQNVDYAARLLVELKQREKTWTMAVARYNAGPNNNPGQKKYVCSVIRNMVASGFGSWTANAKAFCQ